VLPHPVTGQLFPSPVPPGTGWPDDPAAPDTPVARTADEVAALEFSSGSGRNAAIGTRDGARSLEGHPGGHADKTLGQSLKDSLRLYALVAQFNR